MSSAGIGDEYIYLFERYSKKSVQKNDFVHMITVGPLSAIQSIDVKKLGDNKEYMS